MNNAAAFPVAEPVADIERNIGAVRSRIAAACARVSRDPEIVELLPVTKTVDDARIRFAHAAGCRRFGENKVQEMQGKAERLADLTARWSLIGRLQTNKVKHAARLADEFQALGSLKLAEALHRRLEIEDRTLDVYVQVNSSGEASKYGLDPGDVLSFVRELPAFDRLQVKGLMTLAVFSADESRVRGCFRLMRSLREMLRDRAPAGIQVDGLSMGMSGDFGDCRRGRRDAGACRSGDIRRAALAGQPLLAGGPAGECVDRTCGRTRAESPALKRFYVDGVRSRCRTRSSVMM